MINRSGGDKGYLRGRGEILRSLKDQPKRRHFITTFSLIKSEGTGIEDD